jgi:hypothetical protein
MIPTRVDWVKGAASVTPTGYWHEHVNESGFDTHPGRRPAYVFAHTRYPVLPRGLELTANLKPLLWGCCSHSRTSEENPMKTAPYCTFLLALFVTGMPAKASGHPKSDDRRHSKTVIVESPSAHPELPQADGEALYLHARGDGRTFLLVEGIEGKTISILDVTNPAKIHGIARATVSATGPFDFVQSLNDRAILISYRDQTGLAVLDFKKFDRPIVTQISSGARAIPTQTIDDSGALLQASTRRALAPETRATDFQVIDTSAPLRPEVVAIVPGVKQTLLKSDTGTLFLLSSTGITVIRHPRAERDYEEAVRLTRGNW